MNKEELIIVEHLNGWVRASEYFNAVCNKITIASAYHAEFNRANIISSLNDDYVTESGASSFKYEFHNIQKIDSHELHSMMENLFFQCPFEEMKSSNRELVAVTRNNFIVRIIDFIKMASTSKKSQDCFCLDMYKVGNKGAYKGYIFIFPLSERYSINLYVINQIKSNNIGQPNVDLQ